MKQFLDRLILGLPVLFLKQYPYAWIAVVAFWPRSPSIALLFLAVVVVGILSLRWQAAAWISQMRSEHAPENGRFYIDKPAIPWRMAVWKISLLLLGAAVIGFLLKGQLGLTFWQFFVMIVGFALFYQDNRFFGAEVTYVITASGIGVRFVPGHLEYRLFLLFREISRIEKTEYLENSDTIVFARTREKQAGLLLVPKDARGFSRRINQLFIAPGNIEKFLEQLPYGYGKASSKESVS